MSKTISIQESGLAKTLTVDALRLPNLGGGTLDVVPADGKNLVKITVKQNGTYKASDFGAYGIAEVRVACTLNGGSATSSETSKNIGETFNPAPKEGGIVRTFTVKRIETQLSGGGSCQWLQKSDVTLGTKSINVDNTTYHAADDGYYGYSQVVVSGISITKHTDGDGNEVVEHTDGTGTVTEIVPSSIALEPAPSFLGPYSDGASISFEDMVVKAYKGDGNLWSDANHPNGVIPFGELILPVTVVDASQVTGETASSDMQTDPASPLKIGGTFILKQNGQGGGGAFTRVETYTGATFCIVQSTDNPNHLRIIGASASNGKITRHYILTWDATGEVIEQGTDEVGFNSSYTYDNKTVYYYYTGFSGLNVQVLSPSPEHLNSNRTVTRDTIAWTIIYGQISGGGEAVPVQWSRPRDNEILETSFTITVAANGSAYGGASGGGGQAGETGAGRND